MKSISCFSPCLQNKEYKLLNEQLSTVTSTYSSEMEKVKKELERFQQKKGDSNQVASLQEEIDSLRLALERAHGERKIVEDTYAKEKDVLQKVMAHRGLSAYQYQYFQDPTPLLLVSVTPLKVLTLLIDRAPGSLVLLCSQSIMAGMA